MAEVPPIPRESWIPALSEAGWDPVSDRILHGLCHNLAGRASSLGGLTFLLGSGPGDIEPVMDHLDGELEQLERSLALLRLLPDDAKGEELLAPMELIQEAMELVGVQRGIEDVGFFLNAAPDAPAIRIDPTFFLRSIVLLLTAAAEAALLTGDGQVKVQGTQKGGMLVLEVTPGFPVGEERSVDPAVLPKRVLPTTRIGVLLGVLQENGIRAEGFGTEEKNGQIRLYFPPSSSA